MIQAVEQDRLAYLELSGRFATGQSGLGTNISAALRLYQTAAKIGYPGVKSLDHYSTIAIPLRSTATHSNAATSRPEAVSERRVTGQTIQMSGTSSQASGSLLKQAWLLTGPLTYRVLQGDNHTITLNQAGDYTVRHVVMNDSGQLDYQQHGFTIAPQPPHAPTPQTPSRLTPLLLAQPPVFAWSGSVRAESYQISILSADGTVQYRSDPLPAAQHCNDERCTYTLPRALLNDDNYTWRITAYNAAGPSEYAGMRFSVDLPQRIDLCAGQTLDTTRRAIPTMTKPAAGQTFTDPAFGTALTRISHSKTGEVVKPAYSTMQAWNADESLLLLYHTSSDAQNAGHYLYNGQSYQFIKKLPVQPSDIEEIFWSYVDPDTLYYLPKNDSRRGQFLRYSVSANADTLIDDFSDICPNDQLPVAGADVQMHAMDDDLFAFRCGTGTSQTLFSYRISTAELNTLPPQNTTDRPAWLAPNPLSRGNGHYLYGTVLNQQLQPTTQADLANPLEHSSLGLTADGANALYQVAFNASPNSCDAATFAGVAHLVEHNLDSGACRPLISQANGYPYPTSGTHISATAYQQPGWVALSSVGYGSLSALSGQTVAPLLLSEIYLSDTQNSGRVCRLAHHRSFGKAALNGGYPPYFGEPHATISPSGTRILFGSDWYDSGAVDTYVIDLRDGL